MCYWLAGGGLERGGVGGHLWPVERDSLVQRGGGHGVGLVVDDHESIVLVEQVDESFKHAVTDRGADVGSASAGGTLRA